MPVEVVLLGVSVPLLILTVHRHCVLYHVGFELNSGVVSRGGGK